MRVWVTRDEKPDGPLSTALRSRGLTVIHEPVITRRRVDDADADVAALGCDDWLVLTSPYAVEAISVNPPNNPKVAVVGESSRITAISKGLRVALVSQGGDAKSLFAELREKTSDATVCYPRSSLAKPPEAWANVTILAPVLYVTEAREFDRTVVERVDLIAITSPSAADTLHAANVNLRNRVVASIGPSTSSALRSHGLEPTIEAPQRSLESLADAIQHYAHDSRHQRA